MNNNIKEIFKMYEVFGGFKSLTRFMKFSQKNCDEKTYKSLEKLLKSFEKKILNNKMYVRKDFVNFQNYVLHK